MTDLSFWQRARRARIVQVLAVYLAASWLVLQIAEVLGDGLALPDWIIPVAVILLLVGLVVVLSTAWVQSRPDTDAREQAGEVPGDWSIAPRDAVASVLRGRLPHPTWGRVITGGIMTLILLFAGAGLYVMLSDGSSPLAPAEASAAEAAEGIAVIPFDVRGEGLEIWREGMMDLLTNNLDGVGGFRTIDARTIMARWQERLGNAPAADLDAALEVASSTGARYGLMGSVVGLGSDVRLVANIYDLDTGEEVAQGQAEGAAGELLRLVDELAVGTMRDLLRSTGREGSASARSETLTTRSLPALRAFLEGETHYRHGRFGDAVASYERAVTEDTAFAVALVRLAESYGWLESEVSERLPEYGARAAAHADRLPARYRAYLEGWTDLMDGSPESVPVLEEAVRQYPDDPEAWFLLAETYLHIGEGTYGTEEATWEALERAVALDPNFAPYLIHLAESAVLRGELDLARETAGRHARLTGERWLVEQIDRAIAMIHGDSAQAAAVTNWARTAPRREVETFYSAFARRHDRWDREESLEVIRAERWGSDVAPWIARYAGAMGELERGARLVARLTPAHQGFYWGHMNLYWDVAPPGESDPVGPLGPESCDDPEFTETCHLLLGVAFTGWGRWDDHDRSLARLREETARLREDDPGGADRLAAYADVLEGTGLWRRGERRRGRALLERHLLRSDWAGGVAHIQLGWIELDEDRPAEALRHFRTELVGFERPIALYGTARALDRLGQRDEARQYWRRLAVLTRTGDDLPRIREARRVFSR